MQFIKKISRCNNHILKCQQLLFLSLGLRMQNSAALRKLCSFGELKWTVRLANAEGQPLKHRLRLLTDWTLVVSVDHRDAGAVDRKHCANDVNG